MIPILYPGLFYVPQAATSSLPLYAWYKFNGNGNDSSGNGFNGSFNDVPATFVTGISGSEACVFDGSSQYLNAGNIANFTTESFTISTWISASSFSDVPVLFSNGTVGNVGYIGAIQTTGQIISFTAFEGNGIETTTNAGALNTGSWYNLAFVFNLEGLTYIYINGVQSATTQPTNNGTPSSTLPFVIGSFKVGEDTPTQFFGGLMQDFRIYQAALTGTQIATLYAAGPQ